MSANTLLKMTFVAGIQVVTSVPQSWSEIMGNIKHLPLKYINAQLLE